MVKPEAIMRYIADGFLKDADQILKAFSEEQTFKFSVFSRLWREANFSFVYMGRETEDELREFTSECFLITLKYLTPVSSVRFKVGALYLLYALYVKQPLEHKFRIRVNLAQWYELSTLVDTALEEDNLCVCYVFNKLVIMNAFHAVAHSRLLGPRVTLSCDVIRNESRLENLKSILEEFVNKKWLKRAGNIQEKYENLKKKLFGVDNTDLNLILPNKCDALIMKAQTLLQKGINFGHSTMFSDNYENIGDRRMGIKTKQYEKQTLSRHTDRYNELQEEMYLSNVQSGTATSEADLPLTSRSKLLRKKRRRIRRKRGRPKKANISEDERIAGEEVDLELEADYEEMSNVAPSNNGVIKKKKMQRIRKTYYHYNGDSDEDPFDDIEW